VCKGEGRQRLGLISPAIASQLRRNYCPKASTGFTAGQIAHAKGNMPKKFACELCKQQYCPQ
jgi:hypothetical protein